MPFIETGDEREYPWWAAARWLDDGTPALLYEYFLERRARDACPSEFADAIKGAAPAPARESAPRAAASTPEEGASAEAGCTCKAETKRKTRHSRVAARRDAPRG